MYGRSHRIHFVGIGGAGMSGIAEVMLDMGYPVSGSDLKSNEATERLIRMGGRIVYGHAPSNVEGAQVVVHSSAVPPDNPELKAARAAGMPVITRAEMLAELMRMKYGVAVGGAHGKTTTTSMVAAVLARGGLDPTIVVGGRLHALGANARLGHGQFLVAEADESDGSFLELAPAVAVVTNIDREHMDHYRDLDAVRQAFIHFANRVPFYGLVVLCADDPEVQGILPFVTKRTLLYGTAVPAALCAEDIHLEGGGSRFRVTRMSKNLGTLQLQIPGRHNVLNALAAVAVGQELGLDWDAMAAGLKGFQGAERRFQRRGEANGVSVVEDYGHHPTEIAAVIAAARPIAAKGRLIVAFQPHRFSRTQSLMNEFGPAFAGADAVFLTDIYAASEEPIAGVDVDALAGAVRGAFSGAVHVVKALHDMPAALAQFAKPGDLIVLLGAGSIGSIAPRVLDELKKGSRH